MNDSKENMTVLGMVETYLKENGFDGLFNTYGECCCLINDIAPCDHLSTECEAGYRVETDDWPLRKLGNKYGENRFDIMRTK